MPDNETPIASYSQIRKSGAYLAVGKFITPLVTFLITIYIVRMLSVEEFGIFNVLTAAMAYIGLFSSLGLPSIFQRFIPEFHAKNETGKIKKLVLHGSLFRTALAVFLILLIILFSDLSGRLFQIEGWLGYFQLFSFAILFFLEAELMGVVLTSLFLHKYYVISTIAYIVIRAGLLYYLLSRGLALKGLLMGEVAMYALFLILLIIFYIARFSRKSRQEVGKDQTELPVRRLAKYGAYSYFNEMGVMVLNVSTDYFIISAFLGPVAVGIYAFANRVTMLLSRILPHALLQEVIQPSFFSKYVGSDSGKSLEKMGNLLVKVIAFFTVPMTFAIIVLGDKVIIHLFDPKYLSSLKVMWIVASFLAIRHFQAPLGLILQSLEKVNFLFYSKIFAVYNLILDLIVVQYWGVIGVALVTGSAVLFQNVFLYFAIKKSAGIRLSLKPILTVVANSLPMAAALYFLRGFITGLVPFAIVVVLGSLVYLAACYVNKTFAKEEQNIINKIIGKPLFKF
jgi:O-antigen/teichoic acid export membrane protein